MYSFLLAFSRPSIVFVGTVSSKINMFFYSSVIMTMSGRKEVVRIFGGIVVGGELEYL